ncbi:MAG: hypothetical protein LBU37_05420, partial [Tannerellaceae bacterium]|nr:hypothetical protein [Tannerellaceae bacterium]
NGPAFTPVPNNGQSKTYSYPLSIPIVSQNWKTALIESLMRMIIIVLICRYSLQYQPYWLRL